MRLQLDPNRTVELYLDGALWPRSRELSAELPALIGALSADLGPIALVGYHRHAWNTAPGRMTLGGNDIHLEAFDSPGPPAMVVIADSARCVNLRVVPPDTDAASAAQAMSVAMHRCAEADIDGQARPAAIAETRSLEEVATRIARLPANSGPGRAALISHGSLKLPTIQQRTDSGIRADPRRAHRPRATAERSSLIAPPHVGASPIRVTFGPVIAAWRCERLAVVGAVCGSTRDHRSAQETSRCCATR